MNKLVFNDVGLWPHSQELCELSRTLVANGDNVYFLSSNDNFIGNPTNPLSFCLTKWVTFSRNYLIHKELKRYGIKCYFVPYYKNGKRSKFSEKISKNLLNSIYASYCEILKDGLADRESRHFLNFQRKALISIEKSFKFLNYFISKNNIQEIIVWNGRRPGEVFLVDLAKLNSIKYSSIISSQLAGKYAFRSDWENVNDIKFYSIEILKNLEKYNKYGFSEESIYKSDLYYQRAKGAIKKPKSFNSRGFYTYSENYIISEKLNKKISYLKSLNKKIVSIFPGTFMEYMSLPNYCDDKIFPNHYEHIKFLLSLKLQNTHHFILRFHPNQQLIRFKEKLELEMVVKKAKSISNFDVVLPNENVSSYEIISNSDIVIGIGSSISVEALRMQKKVLFLGCNWFQNLESLYKPSSKKDIISFLSNDIAPPQNAYRDTILYVETFLDETHYDFKYYKSLDQIINPSFLNKFLRKLGIFFVMKSKVIFSFSFSIINFWNKFEIRK